MENSATSTPQTPDSSPVGKLIDEGRADLARSASAEPSASPTEQVIAAHQKRRPSLLGVVADTRALVPIEFGADPDLGIDAAIAWFKPGDDTTKLNYENTAFGLNMKGKPNRRQAIIDLIREYFVEFEDFDIEPEVLALYGGDVRRVLTESTEGFILSTSLVNGFLETLNLRAEVVRGRRPNRTR